jgi:hypothetical protein
MPLLLLFSACPVFQRRKIFATLFAAASYFHYLSLFAIIVSNTPFIDTLV